MWNIIMSHNNHCLKYSGPRSRDLTHLTLMILHSNLYSCISLSHLTLLPFTLSCHSDISHLTFCISLSLYVWLSHLGINRVCDTSVFSFLCTHIKLLFILNLWSDYIIPAKTLHNSDTHSVHFNHFYCMWICDKLSRHLYMLTYIYLNVGEFDWHLLCPSKDLNCKCLLIMVKSNIMWFLDVCLC